ncbi:MAG: peptidase MA family metallohydrolase [Planctomycetota bacterium]|nr:peptidase MA family metallohydrolase [Planctomycetota bacterium]MDA0920697.1 peptidase MA family metallohydrolase [Planctomycetota bacterium]MDA1158201.1 peptidase MA family metallohydrolase [Planctomycetota bacterium]
MAAPADRLQSQSHRQSHQQSPVAAGSRSLRIPKRAERARPATTLTILLATCLLTFVLPARAVQAAELAECREMLIRGDYQECILATHEAITKNRYGESWPLIKAQAEAASGQFDTSLMTIANGLRRYSWSIRLRWLAREAALRSGRAELADALLTEIRTLVMQFSWRYTDAEEIVILGLIDQLDGRDAREILDERFEKAKLRSRTSREPLLAIGDLALRKNDDALAADNFKAALELFPDDPDFVSGLARAMASSDRQAAMIGIEAALKANPKHIPSLLFQIEGLIDAEQYDAAIELLDRVLAIDSLEPDAWAYKAVIAHLTNDVRGETNYRDKALARWTSNPRIDHLIGRKLSQHYRFREGAAYQRKSLALKADFAPAQRQLADDLLRLGEDVEGWKVAHEAYDSDSYNVATYNLLELHDELDKFTTLQDDSFTLRMETVESKLYGAEVLTLLHRAKQTLCSKYGLELNDRVTVEVFPNEDDFAVRTFGMPAVSGYLGVCFGRVITANSPASRRENPSNWEAVLWHEFCHVVTLELTQNRIPRWLSEGISVYEELQENASWGQRMDPRYREHILNDGLTPLSELSSAFMRPESGWHLQFAYFESAMAVDFLVQNFGIESLRAVLSDLKAGLPVNVALDRRCDALAELETRFGEFAKKQAESLAPGVDWEKPDLEKLLAENDGSLEAWVKDHPKNFVGQMALAQQQLAAKKWDDAESTLRQLIEIYPTYIGGDNAYERLASVYQKLDRPTDERKTLEQFASISADAVPANLRLIELQTEASDWAALDQTTARLFAIDPLLEQPHSTRAIVAEKRNQPAVAARAFERLLLLEPDDPADIHYRFAKSLAAQGQYTEAKRQTLMALEEAPRFRDAHRLLLELVQQETARSRTTTQ